MRLAAVRPVDADSDQPVVICDCAGLKVSLGQIALVAMKSDRVVCRVVVAPEQFVQTQCDATTGTVISIDQPSVEYDEQLAGSVLEHHVAAPLPVLGETISSERGPGQVVGLDVPRGLAVVRLASGETLNISF